MRKLPFVGRGLLVVAGFLPLLDCGGDENAVTRSNETDAGECLPNEEFFEREVWARALASRCVSCHTPDGVAVVEGKSRFVLYRETWPGFLQENLRNVSLLAREDVDGKPKLLQKALGNEHGGGAILSADDPSTGALSELVRRLRGAAPPCPGPGTDLSGIVLMSPRETFRKAALNLGGRLPTKEEHVETEEDLARSLDRLLSEDGFLERVKEIYNDVLLVRVNRGPFYSPTDFPPLKTYRDNADFDPERRALLGVSMAEEPLALIAHIVKNDRPFSEILTAKYTVANPYTAIAYGASDSFPPPSPSSASDWREIQVVRKKGTDNEALTPHAGVLTAPAFLERWPTSPTNKGRGRARVVFRSFLSTDLFSIAERPLSSESVGAVLNAPRENPACATCHEVMDPVAGAFRGWNAYDQSRFDTEHEWHEEMKAPGYAGEKMPAESYGVGLQWLGSKIAADPNFSLSVAQTLFRGLTGHAARAYPRDTTSDDFGDRRVAWKAEDAWIRKASSEFAGTGMNLKSLAKAIVMSPYFRGKSSPTPNRVLYESVGGTRLLTPEMLTRKLKAIVGVDWGTFDDKGNRRSRLASDGAYGLAYGGIDSNRTTTRLTTPSPSIVAIADRMSTEVACRVTAWDFTIAKDGRRLFPHVEISTRPGEGDAAIRNNIVYLHERVLGEVVDGADPEVMRTEALFRETYEELKASGDPSFLDYACSGRWERDVPKPGAYNEGLELSPARQITSDPNYTVRAWMAVLTYLLSDYRFLFE